MPKSAILEVNIGKALIANGTFDARMFMMARNLYQYSPSYCALLPAKIGPEIVVPIHKSTCASAAFILFQ